MQKQSASVTNWLPARAKTAEELGPDDERGRLKVNGGLPGRIRGRRISQRKALDERYSDRLSIE
jgi:hypothetical protein